jgi:hypothetical protein
MPRLFLITDLGEIELTNDLHILRNLNWCNPRLLWRYPSSRVNG